MAWNRNIYATAVVSCGVVTDGLLPNRRNGALRLFVACENGLRRGGYTELAREIAYRYCRMSCERAKGNYENFDALTGIGRCAPGYTWAASVYVLLCGEYGF